MTYSSLFLSVSLVLASVFASAAPKASVRASQGACIFGSNIGELEENPRFQVKSDVIKTFKVARSTHDSKKQVVLPADYKPPMVSVSVIKDLKTKKVYHMNTTFRHIDDGDNTIGWIEEVNDAENLDDGFEGEGRVVVEIGDSEFGPCLIRE